MSTPGSSSALRVGGFALLGVGVVAAVIGFASLAGNGSADGEPVAAPTGETSATGAPTGAPTDTPSATGEIPLPSFPSETGSPLPTVPPPVAGGEGGGTGGGAGAAAGGSGGGAARPTAKAPIRVYNNSTVQGLAAEAAADFRNAGWTVTEIGAYSSANLPTSTVYFRPGTDEEAAAAALANEFGLRSNPRFEGIRDANPGLIVIVTKDYQRR